MRRVLLSMLVLILLVPAAHAGDFILGASIGEGSIKGDVDNVDFDTDDFAWKATLGFRFFKFFGIEGGYRDWGSQEDARGGVSVEADLITVDAFAVGVIPIRKLELFGKAGYIYWDADTDLEGLTSSDSSDDGLDFAWGVGVAWKFTDLVALRGEYESFEIDATDDATFLSVGVDFRF